MDELVNRIARSTDIPEDKARKAVEMVLSEVKESLPAALAAEVDAQVRHGRSAPIAGGVDAVTQGLGRRGQDLGA
jgi:uncharacterized protein (DUF2267 family)